MIFKSYDFYIFLVFLGSRGISAQTTLEVVWMAPSTSHPGTNFAYNASSSVAALALGIQHVETDNIIPGYVMK